MGKDGLTPHEQRDRFARAFATVRHYSEEGNHIAAYVIAFSILEGRVTQMYHSLPGTAGSAADRKHQQFKDKLKALARHGVIGVEEKECWLALAYDRNAKLHAAMWNLDEFQVEDIARLCDTSNRASNLRKAQRRQLAAQVKQDTSPA